MQEKLHYADTYGKALMTLFLMTSVVKAVSVAGQPARLHVLGHCMDSRDSVYYTQPNLHSTGPCILDLHSPNVIVWHKFG